MVNATQTAVSSGITAGINNSELLGTGAPETGEFDFLGYLLGLQGNVQDAETAAPALLSTATPETVTTVEPKSVKTGKEDLQWNPLFPGVISALPEAKTQVKAEVAELPVVENARSLSSAQSSIKVNAELPIQTNQTAITDTQSETKTVNPLQLQQMESKGNQSLMIQNRQQTLPETDAGMEKMVFKGQPLAAKEERSLSQSGEGVGHSALLMALMSHGKEGRADKIGKRSEGMDFFGTTAMPLESQSNLNTTINTSVAAAPGRQDVPREMTVPEMSQQISHLIQHGGGSMTVRLNPPDLGQVEIQVVAKGRRVEVDMTSDNEMTKSLIESQLGDLHKSIQGHDLQLARMEVHVAQDGFQQDTQSFLNQSGQFSRQQDLGHGSSNRKSQENNQQLRSLASISSNHTPVRASHEGRVDVRI